MEELKQLLIKVRAKISPNTCMIWTKYDSPEQLTDELDIYIKDLQEAKFQNWEALDLLFSPTGTLQECSISNAWGNDYLQLANEYDKIRSGL